MYLYTILTDENGIRNSGVLFNVRVHKTSGITPIQRSTGHIE